MTAILQSDRTLETALDFDRPGFVMAPFLPEKAPLVFLRPDALYCSKSKPAVAPLELAEPHANPISREIHIKLVQEVKEHIEKGEFKKVVVSRRYSVPIKVDIVSLAFRMIQAYPQAFGYLFHHPDIGTWMGATPELLLRSQSGIGETVALAGTRSSDPTEKASMWTPKELYEQQVVTDFILKQMKASGLKPETGPVENFRAGKLWHLSTSVRAPLPPDKAEALLRKLHPTPAVCGLPRDKTKSFISTYENYNREYYTGFLGEVGIDAPDSFETFVNLRCMQIRNGRAYLYMGGGITTDSDPESEWEETQQKSTTMLSLLENSSKAIG